VVIGAFENNGTNIFWKGSKAYMSTLDYTISMLETMSEDILVEQLLLGEDI
jgi:hypothetical protein